MQQLPEAPYFELLEPRVLTSGFKSSPGHQIKKAAFGCLFDLVPLADCYTATRLAPPAATVTERRPFYLVSRGQRAATRLRIQPSKPSAEANNQTAAGMGMTLIFEIVPSTFCRLEN